LLSERWFDYLCRTAAARPRLLLFFFAKEHFELILAKNVTVKNAYEESSMAATRLENKQRQIAGF